MRYICLCSSPVPEPLAEVCQRCEGISCDSHGIVTHPVRVNSLMCSFCLQMVLLLKEYLSSEDIEEVSKVFSTKTN